jgi:hypothetical protein
LKHSKKYINLNRSLITFLNSLSLSQAFTSISVTASGTSPSYQWQQSADGSTGWADVVGAAFTSVTAGPSAQRLAFNVGACRGIVRLSITVSGASAAYDVGVVAMAKRT